MIEKEYEDIWDTPMALKLLERLYFWQMYIYNTNTRF